MKKKGKVKCYPKLVSMQRKTTTRALPKHLNISVRRLRDWKKFEPSKTAGVSSTFRKGGKVWFHVFATSLYFEVRLIAYA
jgi:hypothetical protein